MAKRKLVEARVLTPNIRLTSGARGEKTESPAVGSIIKVRPDQVSGGLKGKVRLVADERPEDSVADAGTTVETATAFLEAAGYTVSAPGEAPAGVTVETATAALEAAGYTVSAPDPK